MVAANEDFSKVRAVLAKAKRGLDEIMSPSEFVLIALRIRRKVEKSEGFLELYDNLNELERQLIVAHGLISFLNDTDELIEKIRKEE